MAFKLKPIKPKAQGIFDVPRVEAAVRAAMQQAADEAVELYEQATKTWEHQPAFEQVPVKDGIIVGTDSDIFGYVDEGTKPHTITIKNARVLRFRRGYQAKTSPGVLGSGSGGASGEYAYAKTVQHPGTKARNFTRLVQQKSQGQLPVIVAQKLGGLLGD